MSGNLSNGPINDPVNNPGSVFSSFFDTATPAPTSSAAPNLNSDTLAAISNAMVDTPVEASNPNLSIFNFGKLISSARRANKEANDAFDLADAGLYRDLHRNAAESADNISQQIETLRDFRDTYNDFITQLDSFATQAQGYISDIQNQWSQFQKGVDFGDAWVAATNAAYVLNNTTTTTADQTQALLDNYLLAVSQYNARASSINGSRDTDPTRILGYNTFIANTVPALQATADQLNQTYQQLQLSSPTVDPIPSLSTFGPIPQYAQMTLSIPPPYPLGLYFDPTDPRLEEPRRSIPDPPITTQGQTVPYPVYPQVTYNVPDQIDHDVYKAAYIQPLLDLLDQIKKTQTKVQNAIDYQQVFRPEFGQVAIGAPLFIPQKSKLMNQDTTGPGTSTASLASITGQNIRLDEQFGQAQLETLYQLHQILTKSPLVANVAGYTEALLTALNDTAVPSATQASQGALVSGTPNQSPAVGASLALSTLEQTAHLVQSDAIHTVLLDTLTERALSDPSNKNIPEATLRAQLEPLARGITALIHLQLLAKATQLTSQATGTPGLIPQILANLASVSPEASQGIVNGLVGYNHLFDTPRDIQLFALTFRNYFEEQLGLDRPQAERVVGQALNRTAALGPLATAAAAKEALSTSLSDALSEENIATDPTLIASGFQRFESSPPQLNLETSLFLSQLKGELARKHLEPGDLETISQRLDAAATQTSTLSDLLPITQAILSDEGVESAGLLTATVAQKVSSPLQNPFITQTAAPTELAQDFSTAVTDLLTHQALPREVANAQGTKYANLLFKDPVSIASLVERNLSDYAKAVGQTQAQAADALFRDTQQTRLSTAAYLAHITDPAQRLVFLSNPIMYGNLQPRIGPAGGALINPIISD